jgi:hypothetical protein
MNVPPVVRRVLVAAFVGASIVLAGPSDAASTAPASFRALGDDAMRTLVTQWYDGDGRWRACLDPSCGAGNVDWGSDSLTGAVYERWLLTHDAAAMSIARALVATQPRYGACRRPRCSSWSDVPMWDAVAAVRTYDVTGDEAALRNAEAAYRFLSQSDVFAGGACPAIDYQRPHAESGGLKTLETDANATLVAAMLAQRTGRAGYLDDAKRRYAAVRAWFLDREVPLYTVYVFDDGRACRAMPHRFFASVNGLMIEAGLILARLTGTARYADEARATAHAIRRLDDDRGIFTDLQAENDVVGPLVLAMLALARDGDTFARDWVLRNAAAAVHARRADGAYGRFFDGPPPQGVVTAWQSNGALALEIAAAALAPDAHAEPGDPWADARTQPLGLASLPQTFRFTGSGIALTGTLGERCCELGRARLLVDGRETFDATGIWQNKSSAGRAIPNTVLFAWRWHERGTHELRLEADTPNAKEGGPFIDVRGAIVLQ